VEKNQCLVPLWSLLTKVCWSLSVHLLRIVIQHQSKICEKCPQKNQTYANVVPKVGDELSVMWTLLSLAEYVYLWMYWHIAVQVKCVCFVLVKCFRTCQNCFAMSRTFEMYSRTFEMYSRTFEMYMRVIFSYWHPFHWWIKWSLYLLFGASCCFG
jgi:hypothetical protein